MDEPDDGSESDRDESGATPDAGEPTDAPGVDDRSSDDAGDPSAGGATTVGDDESVAEATRLREEIRDLREEFSTLEESVDDRTVHRSEIEADLKQYVRQRLRRGHARGWGPYLVLLYGTAMTLGAFYSPVLSNGWTILAMIVIWLSTLGLYVLMVLVGVGIGILRTPGKAIDFVRNRR